MAKIPIDLAKAYRLLEPGPVVLVTAQYRGERNVMTAAWVMPVSSSPPLVALAVFPAHYSHDLIVKGGDFVLNIPARPLAEKVHRTAMVSGRDADKFLTIGLTPFEATRVNSPRIAECMAHLECGVVEKYEVGDHTLFIGEIVAAAAEESAFDGEVWTGADESVTPLQHLGKNMYALMKEKLVLNKPQAE